MITPLTPQPLVISILPSVSINLPLLGTTYKLNHTVFVLLCLAHFTWHNVFKIHHDVACVRVSLSGLNNVPLYAYTTFVYPIIFWWMFGSSIPFGYEICYEHWWKNVCWVPAFNYFGYIWEMELLGQNFMFNILMINLNIFHLSSWLCWVECLCWIKTVKMGILYLDIKESVPKISST